jgi:hypothetical protein
MKDGKEKVEWDPRSLCNAARDTAEDQIPTIKLCDRPLWQSTEPQKSTSETDFKLSNYQKFLYSPNNPTLTMAMSARRPKRKIQPPRKLVCFMNASSQ